MSAPCSIGRIRNGVAMVLSTTRGMPCRRATRATASMSTTSFLGFGSVSVKIAFVSGRMRASHSASSAGSHTYSTVTPMRAKVRSNSTRVPL